MPETRKAEFYIICCKAKKMPSPFPENYENSRNHQSKTKKMVPCKFLILKHHCGHDGKNRKRNHLLNYAQFHLRKRTSVTLITHPVGRYLKNIFKKCQTPAEQNNGRKACFLQPAAFFPVQMPIPCKGHKYIGNCQQQHRIQAIHATKINTEVQIRHWWKSMKRNQRTLHHRNEPQEKQCDN